IRYVQDFEQRFSRFLPHSEVNAFREASPGEYILSKELTLLLSVADRLRTLTVGAYDPAVAGFLESAGYGGQHQSSLVQDNTQWHLPRWSLLGDKLTLDGPIAFDLGGIGKGYCIDRVADILQRAGYAYFLVDGGGDMMATTKADGSAWNVAIEYPGRPEMAASLVHLSHQGLAVSDSFRRRFGKWHHLIDVKKQKSVEKIVGCAAVAESAWLADCMTSGLFFSSTRRYHILAREFRSVYLVFPDDQTFIASADWKGELL
ncbi:MAG TPA: FAD:protein FMN transferase, partial [Patescibacteria group bacterium]|nr:FAD:protein FMN transferase [Patescibacteria group bacterium]